METKKKSTRSAKEPNIWLVVSIVLAIALVGVIAFNYFQGQTGETDAGDSASVVSSQQAAADFLEFIDEIYGAQVSPVTLTSVAEEYGLYKIDFTITEEGTAVPQTVFITKNGKGFTPIIYLIDDITSQFRDYQSQLQAQPPAPVLPVDPLADPADDEADDDTQE